MEGLLYQAHDELTELLRAEEFAERMEEEYGWHEPLYYVNGVVGTVPQSMLTEADYAAGVQRMPPASERRPKTRCHSCLREDWEALGDEGLVDEVEIESWREIIREHARRCHVCGRIWP